MTDEAQYALMSIADIGRAMDFGYRNALWMVAIGANLQAEVADENQGYCNDDDVYGYAAAAFDHAKESALYALASLGDERAKALIGGEG